MRKKVISVMVVSIISMMLLAGCGADQANASTQEIKLSGGWSVSEKSDITAEQKAVFDKATETICGAIYTPVSYLGSQVVAGTNHAFLCRTSPSVKELNTESWWTIVYIYEDLEGKCEIIDSKDIELGISSAEDAGEAESSTEE